MGYLNNGIYYCDDNKDKEKDRVKYREKGKNFCFAPKHPAPKKILLECGNNPEDAIFEIDNGRVDEHQFFVLDTVLVDTTCLFRPLVKIEFSSIIYFDAKAENHCGNDLDERPFCDKELKVDLLFELIRICNGQKECVQSWRYLKRFEIERDDKLEVEFSEPFTVTFCDRVCPACCEYKMVVSGQNFEGEFDSLRVVKPDLSALAQGLCDD